MPESLTENRQPAISIILPTYNRARFLPQALESIRQQQWTDWELIIVDDGSTDDTADIIDDLTADIRKPVQFIQQENQGAYGARNTGLDHATGHYIAFFDSDDEWLPHHLEDCVTGLEANPDIDWVYGACRIIDESTGEIIAPSSFYVNETPKDFMQLSVTHRGSLARLDNRRLIERILDGAGLFSGLQNSVIRSDVFHNFRFDTSIRNEAEDQLFVIYALSDNRRIAYIDNIHVVYRIHSANSSVAAKDHDVEKRLELYEAIVEGYCRLRERIPLTKPQRRALRRRIARESFWRMGYGILLESGRHREALSAFRKGLLAWPLDLRMWKTYIRHSVKRV